MSIATYTDLVAAIDDYLDRDDLAGRVETFCQITEARLNRLLDDPRMEVEATLVAAGNYATLPDDFGSMVSISTGNGYLAAAGAVEFEAFDAAITGTPRYYTIRDGAIGLWPASPSASVTLVYRQRIPALNPANQTNWLLTLAPDVYLYGALLQATAFDADDARVAGWKSMYDEAVAELRADGSRRKWGAGPIAPRIGRP